MRDRRKPMTTDVLEPASLAPLPLRTIVAVAFVFWALAVVLSGCGGDLAVDVSTEAVVLPPPAVCPKDTASLSLFADHGTGGSCSGDDCLPECGADTGKVCPGGAACDDADFGRCHPIDCTANSALCTGGTTCLPDPGEATTRHCGYMACATDDQCPCGAYCNSDTHRCSLDCLQHDALSLICAANLACDPKGRCTPSGGTTVPPLAVVVSANPSALVVPRDANGHYTAVDMTVKVSTTNPALGTGTPPPVTVTPPAHVELDCDTDPSTNPSAAPCTIGGWTFGFEGATYVASRVVRVKVQDVSNAQGWEIQLSTPGVTPPTLVPAVPTVPYIRAGRYQGVLILGSDGSEAIPVDATVTPSAIALHDRARIISPTGTALLKNDGTLSSTSFLGGRGSAALYGRVGVTFQLASNSFDAVLGKLTGTLLVGVNTSQNSESWSFSLTRREDLITEAPCPVGENFDGILQACVPGEWDATPPSASPSVTHDRANAWLNAMTARMKDLVFTADGAVPLAERLLCYDKTINYTNTDPAVSNALQNKILLTTQVQGRDPMSGDLVCPLPNSAQLTNASHNQWGIGLISYADRIADKTSVEIPQFDMLARCVAQMMRVPTGPVQAADILNNECVSLERFYPALFSVAGTAPYRFDAVAGGPQYDKRSRVLFLRLLKQWSQLAGFIARDGTAQRDVANILSQLPVGQDTQVVVGDQPVTFTQINPTETSLLNQTPGTFSYQTVLDAVDNAWTLLLDKRIHQPLVAMPASALVNPDYRELKKPAHYWTFATAHRGPGVVNNLGTGPQLGASAGCTYSGNTMVGSGNCTHSAELAFLGDNLTLEVRLEAVQLGLNTEATLFDHDGLRVSLVNDGTHDFVQLAHRTTSGSFESVRVPRVLVGGVAMVVQRDARAKVYTVTTGASSYTDKRAYDNGLRVFRASYSQPPAAGSSGTSAVGNARSGTGLHLRGRLSQVAVWDSAFSPTEIARLMYESNYSTNLRFAWPADVLMPSASDPSKNESAIGLPVDILEGLVPAMGMIEAYVKDAARTNAGACRLGTPDDAFQLARDRAARSLRLTYAVQRLAFNLHDRAVAAGPVPWEDRYNQAVEELRRARQNTLNVLTSAASCENPMGMGQFEFPLYFNNSDSLVNGSIDDVIDASATFLLGKAQSEIVTASNALNAARNAWTSQFQSGVQQQIDQAQAETRLNDIRSNFGRELVDLCGILIGSETPNSSAALQRFLDPNASSPLQANTCHIQETAACQGAADTPIERLDLACARGQIGEAYSSAASARQRLLRAQTAATATRKTADGWRRHCAQMELDVLGTTALIDKVKDLEIQEIRTNNHNAILSSLATMAGGMASKNPAGVISGLVGFAQGVALSTTSIQIEKAKLQAIIAQRHQEQGLDQCWFQADQAQIPVDTALQDVLVAAADLETALRHAASLQNHTAAVVAQARQAVEREVNRTVPRFAFHYWAQENLQIYQRMLQRARRMTYLFVRAVEHDLQRNFDRTDQTTRTVLGASHPMELNMVVNDKVANVLNHGWGLLSPERGHVAISLCRDVMKLPQRNGETDCNGPSSKQQFRSILLAPGNALRDEGGKYLGQVFQFGLDHALAATPSRGPGVGNRCAENVSYVTARFGDANLSLLPIEIHKRESFYARTCQDRVGELGSMIQEGRLRTANNLLLEGAASQFGVDREWTSAAVNALKETGPTDPIYISDAVAANSKPTLAGRGLYGDYRMVIPPNAVSAVMNDPALDDIIIRFDYVSVANINPIPPGTTPPIEITKRDGYESPITSGGSVSLSTPAPDGTRTLTASAASGWHFADWGGACSGLSNTLNLNTCRLRADTGRKVWATFVSDDITLNVNKGGNGAGGVASGWLAVKPGAEGGGSNLSWTQSIRRPNGSGTTAITLEASPSEEATFTGWSGGCSGTAPTCTVTLGSASSAQNVTANFTTKPVLTLTMRVDPKGLPYTASPNPIFAIGGSVVGWPAFAACSSMSGVPCDTSFTKSIDAGTQLTFLADSVFTNAFVSWSSDVSSCSGASCNVTMDGDHSVVGTFQAATKVTVPRPTNGTIVSSPPGRIDCGDNSTLCSAYYSPYDAITLVAQPAPGYKVNWNADAISCGGNTTCTRNAGQAFMTMKPTFSLFGVCVPGDYRDCCPCGGEGCAVYGEQMCGGNGQWGGCYNYECVPPPPPCRGRNCQEQ
jgi:hypothetical protein